MTTTRKYSPLERVELALTKLKKTKRKTMAIIRVLDAVGEVAAEVKIGRRVLPLVVSHPTLRNLDEASLIALLDEEIRQLSVNKFNAQKVNADGFKFDSQSEYRYYLTLKLMVRAGQISNLEVHPPFVLVDREIIGGEVEKAIKHKPDFWFRENGRDVVVDVKGVKTIDWVIRRRLFRKRYPQIEYRVVLAKDVK